MTHRPFPAPAARRFKLLPLAAATALTASSAFAQQAPLKADDGKVETVVITATKRIQPLQATPIAVSVISGNALEESNLNNLEAVIAQVPTVNFRTNASNKDAALFIRGVGTISTSPGVEPTVSTVLDGVVTARPGQATLDLVEIDRIEILRGPQGTLFGKNASAGVINIVTRAPSKEFSGYADLGLYQGGEKRIRLGVSSELAKDLKIVLIADRVQADDTPPTGVPISASITAFPSGAVTVATPSYAAAVAPVVLSPSNRQINSEMKTRVSDLNQGFSAQVDYSLGGHQLTSITALRKWTNEQFQDQDRMGTLYRGFNRTADKGNLDFQQTTQELRIASTQRSFMEYVAGLYYMKGKDDERYQRDTTRCATSNAAALPSGLVPCTTATTTVDYGVALYGVRNKSLSLFGESTFNFLPDFRALAGLRYTKDDLSYYHGRVYTPDPTTPAAVSAPGINATRARVGGSTSENAVSGRIGPQFDINKDMMGYITVSRGYKGPAFNAFFNMQARDDIALAPEKSKSIEAGLKSTLWDGRMRLNLAVFHTDYTGYQANVPDLVGGVVVTRLINAGTVTTSGFEVDMTARVTPQLTVTFALANIEARIVNFNCPPGAAASCNINGRPLPFSPDWKGSLRAKYMQPLAGKLTLEYGVDANRQSATNFDITQQPDSVQPAYTVVNASLALVSTAGWRVSLLGKNLGDKSYATFIQNSGNNINRYVPRDDKRYFGINARYDF